MSEADWRTVGYIGVTIGVLLLIGGFIAYYFPQDYYILGYKIATIYPYRDYSVGLFVAGVALAVAGGGSWWRADIEKQKNAQATRPAVPYPPQFAQSVPRKFCRFCGTENKSDAVFCEKCGRQIAA